ncbi:MAG: outer membrane protein assembly factor BamE [Rickettsiaceae bacterium]|nr:MAG: outer membrane protein assembly factor BamE [Rickettsiaceae bacterium]
MKLSSIKAIFSYLIFLLLSSCQTIDTRGQYVDDASISQLKHKNITKEQVVELIGSPTIVSDYNLNTWYYIQILLAKKAWLTPKVIEQRIVELKFDNNIVSGVTLFKDSHIENIVGVSDYTQTYGTEANGIQKFVKNIGYYNKNKKGKRKDKSKK